MGCLQSVATMRKYGDEGNPNLSYDNTIFELISNDVNYCTVSITSFYCKTLECNSKFLEFMHPGVPPYET